LICSCRIEFLLNARCAYIGDCAIGGIARIAILEPNFARATAVTYLVSN